MPTPPSPPHPPDIQSGPGPEGLLFEPLFLACALCAVNALGAAAAPRGSASLLNARGKRHNTLRALLAGAGHNPPHRSQYLSSTWISEPSILLMKFMICLSRIKENAKNQKSPGAAFSAQGSFLLR